MIIAATLAVALTAFPATATPVASSGVTRDITRYGATPDDASDDDGGAVRAALASASAGDEIYIPNGTYHLKKRRIDLKSGVSVRGESRDGAILLAQFASVADGKDGWILGAQPGTRDLTLSTFTVTSNGSTTSTAAMNYGIWLGNGDSACATIACDRKTPAVSGITVRNINLQKFVKMGMNVRNGRNVVIEDNWIHSALADGGGGQGYGVMLGYGQTENTVVRRNLIEAGSGKMRHGVLLQYRAHHNLVESNTVRNHNEDLIDLHGEGESNNEIRDNTLTGSARACIGIGNTGGSTDHGASGPDNWIHHNTASNCLKGLHLIQESHRQLIEDNVFRDNHQFGIHLTNGSGDHLRIRRNTITGSPVGLRLEESDGTLLECNDVTGNSSESLHVAETATSYTIRHNDFRGAPITLAGSHGTYTANCDDTTNTTDCLTPCSSLHRPPTG